MSRGRRTSSQDGGNGRNWLHLFTDNDCHEWRGTKAPLCAPQTHTVHLQVAQVETDLPDCQDPFAIENPLPLLVRRLGWLDLIIRIDEEMKY